MSVERYNENARELGAKIKQEIKRAGITQAEFADSVGVTASRLSNYITGARLPDVFILSKIAECLGVSMDYLLGFSGRGKFPRKYSMTIFESGAVKIIEQV